MTEIDNNISEKMALKQRIRLDEVTLMRTILALLIVFMHSFTCYQGGWAQPVGYVDIQAYNWIARTSFAFTLEAFVFISGYLFAFQLIALKRTENCISLILNKLKRLILPSIIFSTLYFSLFYEYKGIPDLLYNLVNGCGHMWFLPMLFWCFVLGWLLEQIKIGDGWKLAFLVLLNLFSLISLPLRIKSAAIFMVYFYGGFLVYKRKDNIKAMITPNRLIIGWLIFVAVFAVFRPLRDVLVCGDGTSKTYKLVMLIGNKACQLIYASLGVMIFYATTIFYVQKHKLKPFTIKLASCCFGIYLFQQFVLQLLYYKTGFSLLVGPYWLPWCGFVIAAIVSYVLSALLVKTKVGRFLIG